MGKYLFRCSDWSLSVLSIFDQIRRCIMSGKRVFLLLLVIVAVFVSGIAVAEERLGVQVYPGSKFDADTTKAVKDMLKCDTFAYQTDAPLSKVVAFYKSQKDLKTLSVTNTLAGFENSKNVQVTISTPWMNMKTGTMMKNTLIQINKLRH
jgi:hypothetical protein